MPTHVAITRVGRRLDIPYDADVLVWTFDINVTSVTDGSAFTVNGDIPALTLAGPGAKEITTNNINVQGLKLEEYAVVNANGTDIVFAGAATILDQSGIPPTDTCMGARQRLDLYDSNVIVWTWDHSVISVSIGDVLQVNGTVNDTGVKPDSVIPGPGANQCTAIYSGATYFLNWVVLVASEQTDIVFGNAGSIFMQVGSTKQRHSGGFGSPEQALGLSLGVGI